MEITSAKQFIRITPRKMRLVAPLIKGMSVEQALIKLRFTPKDAAKEIIQVLRTAQADAVHNHKLNDQKLIVKTVEVTDGPTLKRGLPVSRGNFHQILKRTSHIKVILEG